MASRLAALRAQQHAKQSTVARKTTLLSCIDKQEVEAVKIASLEPGGHAVVPNLLAERAAFLAANGRRACLDLYTFRDGVTEEEKVRSCFACGPMCIAVAVDVYLSYNEPCVRFRAQAEVLEHIASLPALFEDVGGSTFGLGIVAGAVPHRGTATAGCTHGVWATSRVNRPQVRLPAGM